MKLTGFNDSQKQALMDLLVVGMYADHNLASAEDACVQRLLDTFQFASDYERQKFSDASFTRASAHTGSPEAIRAYVNRLAPSFPKHDDRQTVFNTLNELLTSDGRVTSEECQVLAAVKTAFQL